MGSARKAALAALEKCRRQGAWSDAVLGSVMDAEKLGGRDRALAAALCYGVLQNRILLDAYLAAASNVALAKVEPKVLDILRVSACQILLMDRIPASAAVSEGVELAKALGFARAAGYVNAVLRRLAGGGIELKLSGSDAEKRSVEYSHPVWLVELLERELGAAEAEDYLRLDNLPAPITLQVNTLKTDADALIAALADEGVSAEKHPWLPDCLTVRSVGSLPARSAFRSGLFYVQDAAARAAVLAAQPRTGDRILDCCAAPGGKSFAAAILCGGKAEITACDLHENKLKRLRESAARLGIDRITTLACDARQFNPTWERSFDLVIADVPCSGLGVIRKKPDIRYKDPATFEKLPDLQCAILRSVSRYVAPGGTLLYSTCTIRPEENEAVVRAFRTADPSFSPVDFQISDGTRSADGMLQLWPQRNGTDGFFIAKLRRGP